MEAKQEKKVLLARLEEEVHTLLQRYAAFLDGATHYVIGESLKRLFRRDKEFNQWLVKNKPVSGANSEPQNATVFNLNTAARTAPSAA